MSFDALLSLLFILFFVVLPLIERVRGQQGQGRRSPPPQRRAAPPPARPAQPAQPPARPDQTGRAEEAGGPWRDLLEEARRRVEEAMAEGETPPPARSPSTSAPPAASTTPGAGTAPSGTLPPPPVLDWQPAPAVPPPFIPPVERPRPPQSAPATRPLSESSAALRVTRRAGPRREARLGSGRILALDDKSILSGLIWHEILKEPPAVRRIGRAPSRLRSR